MCYTQWPLIVRDYYSILELELDWVALSVILLHWLSLQQRLLWFNISQLEPATCKPNLSSSLTAPPNKNILTIHHRLWHLLHKSNKLLCWSENLFQLSVSLLVSVCNLLHKVYPIFACISHFMSDVLRWNFSVTHSLPPQLQWSPSGRRMLMAVVSAITSPSILSVVTDPVPWLWIMGRERAHPEALFAVALLVHIWAWLSKRDQRHS